MPTPVYATLDDIINRGYDIAGYEQQAEIFLNDCLTFLRQECKNRGLNFDELVASGDIDTAAVILVQVKRAYEAVKALRTADSLAGTDKENVKSVSTSSSANGYSESQSITYDTATTVNVYVRDQDLALLGINSQQLKRTQI